MILDEETCELSEPLPLSLPLSLPLPKPQPQLVFPDWLNSLYAKPCTFCGVCADRMHFDHINMFEKRACISELVYRGCEQDDILAEISKCQLLCIECHAKVTQAEREHGFINEKRILTKQQRSGQNVNAKRQELAYEYAKCMEPVYERLRVTTVEAIDE